MKQNVSASNVKLELTSYLEDLVLINESNTESFDMLGWWEQNGLKYQTIQKKLQETF